jgi:ribosomal protein S18 acetylase RimI-like enzyme
MLWRVRTVLPDRPGALAELARACGEAGVNILGLQIFPGVEGVTDELVLQVPDDWLDADVAALLARAGGQPTRYVQAARSILAQPASFPEVVARLFDAEPDRDPADPADVMDLVVHDVLVQVRRGAPFTATEHARGAALAGLVTDVLERTSDAGLPVPGRRMGPAPAPELVTEGDAVAALVEGVTVGRAVLRPEEEPGARPVLLRVDPAWRRRGIGTRLLVESARLAGRRGASEIVLTTRADNQAVLPMVLAAGVRGRIRMSSDVVTVRVPVRDLQPTGSG